MDDPSKIIERAEQCIDMLDSAISNYYSNTTGVYAHIDGSDQTQDAISDPRLIAVRNAFYTGVDAVFGVLSLRPSIDPTMTGGPPDWWPKAAQLLRIQAQENCSAEPILNTLAGFEPYLGQGAPEDLIFFAAIVSYRNAELHPSDVPNGLRNMLQPHSQRKIFAVKTKVDDNVHRALEEAIGKPISFLEDCSRLLRSTLATAISVIF